MLRFYEDEATIGIVNQINSNTYYGDYIIEDGYMKLLNKNSKLCFAFRVLGEVYYKGITSLYLAHYYALPGSYSITAALDIGKLFINPYKVFVSDSEYENIFKLFEVCLNFKF